MYHSHIEREQRVCSEVAYRVDPASNGEVGETFTDEAWSDKMIVNIRDFFSFANLAKDKYR